MVEPPEEHAPNDAGHLAEIVGYPFLAFACNASEDEVRSRVHGDSELAPHQEASFQTVLTVARRSAEVGRQLQASERLSLFPLLEYRDEFGTSLANALRRAAGAPIPSARSGDDLTRELETLAIDLYPTLLLAADEPGLSFPLPHFHAETHWFAIGINHHPALGRFHAAVERDAELSQLFDEETPESGRFGFIRLNLGMGRSIQLSMLAWDLLTAAYQTLRTSGELSHERFVKRATEALTTLRILLRGEEVDVEARVALVGVEIQGGSSFVLPWGVLRAPRQSERQAILGGPTSRTQEVVLATTVPLRLRVGRPRDEGIDPEWQRQVADLHHALGEKVQLAALTLLLAFEREPLVATARTWTLIDNPVGQHPLLSWSRDPRPLHPHVLSAGDATQLARWSQLVAESFHSSIRVAASRTLSALAARDEPSDGLVDAVIALENLFAGTAQGELVFRIAAACAYLLEPQDAAEREKLEREVRQLYSRRSKIVHGNEPPPSDEAERDRQRAAELVVISLRILFEQRPDLLPRRDRGKRLVLALPPK